MHHCRALAGVVSRFFFFFFALFLLLATGTEASIEVFSA
jgi:hypothetical protein